MMVSHDKRKTVTKTCGFWTYSQTIQYALSVRCFLFPILNHLITFSKLSGKTKCNRHIHLVIIDFFFTSFANEDIKAIEKLTELQEKSNKNDRSRLCSCCVFFFFALSLCTIEQIDFQPT